MTDEEIIAAAGLKLVDIVDFEFSEDVHDMTRRVAAAVHKQWGDSIVCYRPNGDGYLLMGHDRAEIAAEAAADHAPRQLGLF